MEEMITITKKEYDSLREDHDFLECLISAGVDNWEAYSDACEIYQEEYNKE